MFKLLVSLGFKPIACSFPCASQVELQFTPILIEAGHAREDATLQILTPAREPMIQRTMESLLGAPNALVRVYNATSEQFRRSVFGMNHPICIFQCGMHPQRADPRHTGCRTTVDRASIKLLRAFSRENFDHLSLSHHRLA